MKIILISLLLSGCASTAVLYDKDPDSVKECADLAREAAETVYGACVADKLAQ